MDYSTTKADSIRAPHDVGRTANDFGCRKFTVPTAHAANALPEAWRGARYVIVQHLTGSDFDIAFSKESDAEVDPSVTATAAGASAKVGQRIRSGESVHMMLPAWPEGESLYFVRQSIDASTAEANVMLADFDPNYNANGAAAY